MPASALVFGAGITAHGQTLSSSTRARAVLTAHTALSLQGRGPSEAVVNPGLTIFLKNTRKREKNPKP